MKGGFAGEDVEKGGIVCLDNKEEDLFSRYVEECRANNHVCRIGPYVAVDEVRVPGYC